MYNSIKEKKKGKRNTIRPRWCFTRNEVVATRANEKYIRINTKVHSLSRLGDIEQSVLAERPSYFALLCSPRGKKWSRVALREAIRVRNGCAWNVTEISHSRRYLTTHPFLLVALDSSSIIVGHAEYKCEVQKKERKIKPILRIIIGLIFNLLVEMYVHVNMCKFEREWFLTNKRNLFFPLLLSSFQVLLATNILNVLPWNVKRNGKMILSNDFMQLNSIPRTFNLC